MTQLNPEYMTTKQTKIVASISDLRCEEDFIRSLFEAGMNVVRMNTAHGTQDGMTKLIANVRRVSNSIALLIDTKGPEVRTTTIDGGADTITFHAGDRVRIVGKPELLTTREQIAVSYPNFVRDLKLGADVLIDDGEIEMKVVEKGDDYLTCEVLNESVLGHRKSVNVPGVRINLPSLTEKDKRNIQFAIDNNLDFIAHSFVRNRQDILDIRKILDERHSDIQIIAKIENHEGVDKIDEIIEPADDVKVALGEHGIEVQQENIPGIQRAIIRKCVHARKPVIVATQMLHTMIEHPRPTRAEVTDIANAIYSNTDAVMLSGETAYGKYPVEAVATMARVARRAEADKTPDLDIIMHVADEPDVTAFLAKQAVKATVLLPVKAIITDSYSGRTARYLASYRGKVPVLAICHSEKTMRRLALSYGVDAVYLPGKINGQDYYFSALQLLLNKGVLSPDEMVAYLSSGLQSTHTTFLEINKVSEVLEAGVSYVLPNSNRLV